MLISNQLGTCHALEGWTVTIGGATAAENGYSRHTSQTKSALD